MTTIKLTPSEERQMKAVKKELLTDKNATFTSYARCNEKIKVLAVKYNVDTQVIFNSIP